MNNRTGNTSAGKGLLLGGLLWLAASSQPAVAQTTRVLAQNKTFLQVEGQYQPMLALCDALDSPNVVAVALPDASRRARVTTYSKSQPGRGTYTFLTYSVGPRTLAAGDAGIRNVFYTLTPRDGQPIAPNAAYTLSQGSAAGFPNPTQALTPLWTLVRTREVDSSCRYALNTRLMGFSSRRSVLITETPAGALRYQSFDFAQPSRVTAAGLERSSVPSLTLENGSKQVTPTREVFTFQNEGYIYTITVSRLGQPAGARVRVVQGGQVWVDEVLTGYVFAERR